MNKNKLFLSIIIGFIFLIAAVASSYLIKNIWSMLFNRVFTQEFEEKNIYYSYQNNNVNSLSLTINSIDSNYSKDYLLIDNTMHTFYIGMNNYKGFVNSITGNLKNKNLKKVYIEPGISILNENFFVESSNIEKVFFLSPYDINDCISSNNSNEKIYTYFKELDKFETIDIDLSNWQNYSLANVIYYSNSPYNDVYLVDSNRIHQIHSSDNSIILIDDFDNEFILKPKIEVYRYGYTFNGWFLDIECTIPYLFEKEIVHKKIEIKDDGHSIYHYEPLRLYACWIENK